MSKELLFSVGADDCEWMFFCAGGPGGQHQNKTASACRCRHKESGAEGVSREHREQRRNKIQAFRRMVDSKEFQLWLKLETSRRLLTSEEKRRIEADAERAVEKAMQPENLKIECQKNGKWIPFVESEEIADK